MDLTLWNLAEGHPDYLIMFLYSALRIGLNLCIWTERLSDVEVHVLASASSLAVNIPAHVTIR